MSLCVAPPGFQIKVLDNTSNYVLAFADNAKRNYFNPLVPNSNLIATNVSLCDNNGIGNRVYL